MNDKSPRIFFLLLLIIIFSCAGNKEKIFIPADNFNTVNENTISLTDIVDTQAGKRIENMPDWLLKYIEGGVNNAETLYSFSGKYLFVAKNENRNFNALKKWEENYTVQNNFPMIAATRIERRLISAATLYPDDEYGEFFENTVKKAYNASYDGAAIEDSFWIKTNESENDNNSPEEKYIYFILTSIDKGKLYEIIKNITAEAASGIKLNRKQNAAVKNIQQNFFMGF